MIENNVHMMPEPLFPGDGRVRTLMGRQKPPEEGKGVRGSRFAFCLFNGGSYLVFHTLTRSLLALPPRYIDFFTEGKAFPRSILKNPAASKLYEDHFLVPEHTDESKIYLELKDILLLKEETPRGISQYVILPTSACNARCFYCFEKGMRYRKMSEETVGDTLRFIRSHKPENGGKIRILWFGGEPMCAADNIDRICAGLREAGIDYTAEMISNGSLFTEETACRAADVWKVKGIQITLDGMAEEYANRKRYADGLKDPFGTVVRNIHLLIAAGIRVTVRLNADGDNLGELFRTADFLNGEFDGDERRRLSVYAHSLHGRSENGAEMCPAGAGSGELEGRVLELNDYLRHLGLATYDLDPLFALRTHFCVASPAEHSAVIDAAGQLFACEAMTGEMLYGNVKTGIVPAAWERVASPCAVRDECRRCVFLPRCTEFDRCPNRVPSDLCRELEKRRLEGEMRVAYAVYLDRQRQTPAESGFPAAEARSFSKMGEGTHVSDKDGRPDCPDRKQV